MGQFTNSIFLSFKERLFTLREGIATSKSLRSFFLCAVALHEDRKKNGCVGDWVPAPDFPSPIALDWLVNFLNPAHELSSKWPAYYQTTPVGQTPYKFADKIQVDSCKFSFILVEIVLVTNIQTNFLLSLIRRRFRFDFNSTRKTWLRAV